MKEVRYWVALIDSSASEVTLQEKELAASKWCSWEEAESLVTFERGSGILNMVKGLLDSKNGEIGGVKL